MNSYSCGTPQQAHGFSTADDGEPKVPLTVEACTRPESSASLAEAEAAVRAYLGSLSHVHYREGRLELPPAGQFPFLDAHVESLELVDLTPGLVAPNKLLLAWDVAWTVH